MENPAPIAVDAGAVNAPVEVPVAETAAPVEVKPPRAPADPDKLKRAAEARALTRQKKSLAKAKTEEELLSLAAKLLDRDPPTKIPAAVEALEPAKASAVQPEGWPSEEARAAALEMLLPLTVALAEKCKGTRFEFPPPYETDLPTYEKIGGAVVQTGTKKVRVDPLVSFAQGLAPFVAQTLGSAGGTSPGAQFAVTLGMHFGPGAVAMGAEYAAPKIAAWWNAPKVNAAPALVDGAAKKAAIK